MSARHSAISSAVFAVEEVSITFDLLASRASSSCSNLFFMQGIVEALKLQCSTRGCALIRTFAWAQLYSDWSKLSNHLYELDYIVTLLNA